MNNALKFSIARFLTVVFTAITGLCIQPTPPAGANHGGCRPITQAKVRAQENGPGNLRYVSLGKAKNEKACRDKVKKHGGGIMHYDARTGECYVVVIVRKK